MTKGANTVQFAEAEVVLLIEALDSHEYWQLSEPHERNNGFSMIEDGDNAEVDTVRALISKLEEHMRLFARLTSSPA